MEGVKYLFRKWKNMINPTEQNGEASKSLTSL
jgi:hypothetical protein